MKKRLIIIKQFVQFLKEEKKYWLIPLVLMLLLIGLLVVFSESVMPLIYPLI